MQFNIIFNNLSRTFCFHKWYYTDQHSPCIYSTNFLNRYNIKHLLFILFLLIQNTSLFSQPNINTGKIIIELKNIQTPSGFVRLALYNSENEFMDEEKANTYSFKINKKGSTEVVLENINFGEYAIAVFHDENSNEKLETNLLGIPTEAYCFSGSGHSKWRPPVYKDAKFVVNQTETKLSMQLEKWKL